MRLAADEVQARGMYRLRQIARKRAVAEELQSEKQHEESLVLMFAAERGCDFTSLHPEVALALARATRDALLFENRAARLRVQECEFHLQTLKDAADAAHARFADASDQVGSILNAFDREQIQVDLSIQRLRPSFHLQEMESSNLSNLDTVLEASTSDVDYTGSILNG